MYDEFSSIWILSRWPNLTVPRDEIFNLQQQFAAATVSIQLRRLTDRTPDCRRGSSSGFNESERARERRPQRSVRLEIEGKRDDDKERRPEKRQREREKERVTELLSAADFWFRCANSFHLMRTGVALHQSWKKLPRQHFMRGRATDGETGWWCGHSKVETVFASLHPAGGQWRRRCRPLWIIFVTLFQTILAGSNQSIDTDGQMRYCEFW